MKVKVKVRAFILLAAAAAGCASQAEEASETSGRVILGIERSTGVEMGEEHLVFGSIESMCCGPDGNIALLDRGYSQVRVFSREGEYLRTIGGQGSGPGEMNMTVYMGISRGGRVFVSQRSGCNEFDYETGEWITSESFNGPPSIAITGAPDSCYVAISMEMVETDQGLGIDASVSRFTDCSTTDVHYEGELFQLNPMDMSSFFQKGWYGYSFDVNAAGEVFIARASTDEYAIRGYSPDGTEILVIEQPFTPVPKTEGEIEEEKRFFEARFESLGMGHQAYTPLEHWTSIRSIGIDGRDRIWALRGTEAVPTFDVFDRDGNLLFTAELPEAGEEGRYWRFSVESDLILAWSDDPQSGWQQYHLIPVP